MSNLTTAITEKDKQKITAQHEDKESLIDIAISRLLPRITTPRCDAILTGITIALGISYNILGRLNASIGVSLPFYLIHALSYFVFFKRRAQLNRNDVSEKENLRRNIEETLAVLEQRSSEKATVEKIANYYRCLSEQYHLLAKEIGKKWSKTRTQRFYTFVIEAIKQQILATNEKQDLKLALSLYAYLPLQNTIQRVATGSTIRSVPEALETDILPFDEVSKYYYARCIADKSKTIFVLDGNDKIQQEFYFRERDIAVISSYSQYIGVSVCTVCGVKFFVELIVYDKPTITYDLEKLVREAIMPFDLFFKMIGSNLKNCV